MAHIVVVGAGAVGSYYGALLARAGHDVGFVMRRDLAAVREHGLEIRSAKGDFRLFPVRVFESPGQAGPAEWVICSLKATAIDEARDLVGPCVGPSTRVVALMNGMGIEERLAGWFGGRRVFGAMAFVCLNRGDPGVVHHLEYGRVSIGHCENDTAELESLRALLSSAGIEVIVAPNLLFARWEKLCWNVPFNGLSVAAGGFGTRMILDTPSLRRVAERAMREVASAGNADLALQGSEARLDPDGIVMRMFLQTEAMGDYQTSMVLDYVAGRELEVEAILGEPSRRAASLGVEVPTIDALYSLVWVADRRRRGLASPIALSEMIVPAPVDPARQMSDDWRQPPNLEQPGGLSGHS